MKTTKDLIASLSKYPDDTEWEVIGDRCLASELGTIDLEPMAGNDLSNNQMEKQTHDSKIKVGDKIALLQAPD